MSRRPEIAPLEQRPEHGGRSGHARGGYYCSDDPNVIKWQLAGLERAGVQALFISWWGWGDSDLDGVIEGNPDAYLNRGITALLDQLAAMTSTQRIRAALIVEPFVWTQPRPRIEPRTLQPAQRAMVLDWLWINYHGKDKYREDDLLYGWNLYDEQA